MTVCFGIDVSEHQDGISLVRAAAEGMEFAIVRTTDGTYRDRTYRSHIDDAVAATLPAEAYHYLRNPKGDIHRRASRGGRGCDGWCRKSVGAPDLVGL